MQFIHTLLLQIFLLLHDTRRQVAPGRWRIQGGSKAPLPRQKKKKKRVNERRRKQKKKRKRKKERHKDMEGVGIGGATCSTIIYVLDI